MLDLNTVYLTSISVLHKSNIKDYYNRSSSIVSMSLHMDYMGVCLICMHVCLRLCLICLHVCLICLHLCLICLRLCLICLRVCLVCMHVCLRLCLIYLNIFSYCYLYMMCNHIFIHYALYFIFLNHISTP